MKLYIDTVDLQDIEAIASVYPIGGITCNPSIVKKGNPEDFFKHLEKIQAMFAKSNPKVELHVQVFSNEAKAMVKEAQLIVERLGKDVFVKIPAMPEGYKAMRACKELGFNVTATAIYTYIQAVCSLEAKADVLAPYVNRIENLGEDPYQLIADVEYLISMDYQGARVVGASFKRVEQVEKAIKADVDHVTLSPEVFELMGHNEQVEQAVETFLNDWEAYTTQHPLK